VSLTISSCGVLWEVYDTQMNYLAPQHSLETNKEYQVIWNLTDIQAPIITSASKKIVVEGLKKGNVSETTILGVDSNSGEILWEIPGSISEKITAYGNTLYRGTVGTTIVYAHNIDDGELLWSTWMPTAHSTSSIYVADNKIFVLSNDSEFYILNEEGEILKTYYNSPDMYLEMDNILYIDKAYFFTAINSSSNEELWQIDIGERFTPPIFDDGEIFLRTWNYSASIYSIDQYTGNINWVTSQDLQSNLCIIADKIYFTNPDGELVAISRDSGDEISKVKFSPQFDLDRQIGNYYITCDIVNNVLAVSFGDNTQIMGLKVVNP
jgi:outer membrane protein assembly factor BamB